MQKILILAAIPDRLRLDREIREIEEAIKRAARRDLFEIRIRTAVRPQDIRRAISEERPHIVHFCGHGMEDGSLVLENDEGNHKPILPEGLAALFKLHSDYVTCVLLNACYSVKLAEEISQYINYVIGMNQPIEDQAAITFAQGFYDGLGYKVLGKQDAFQRAFDEGLVAIQLENLKQGQVPVLKQKFQEGQGSVTKVVSSSVTHITPSNTSCLSKTASLLVQRFEFEVVTVNKRGQEVKRERKQAQYFTENLGSSITLDMVAIAGGTFFMGSPEGEGLNTEKPQHKVTITPFFMGKYTVTQAQWSAVAALPPINRELNPNPSNFKGYNLPVDSISWYDAVEFCERLSRLTKRHYRLSSEAEWEYACRAGTTTPFHFGDTITLNLGNYDGSSSYDLSLDGKFRRKTVAVGSFQVVNAFGLYDMHGNVWEWCADHWHDNYEASPLDGNAWLSNDNYQSRLLRGGSWVNNPWDCRSASRDGYPPDAAHSSFGLRVVCDYLV